MDERDDDPCSRVANSVTQSHCASIHIDLLWIKLQDLFGGTNDDGECLVDFEERDIILCQSGLLQRCW